MVVKVECIKEFTLAGRLYAVGQQYDILAKDAKDYREYFERMTPPPSNKSKKTEENK